MIIVSWARVWFKQVTAENLDAKVAKKNAKAVKDRDGAESIVGKVSLETHSPSARDMGHPAPGVRRE